MARTQKQPTFEAQLEQLEAVIVELEQGQLPLDKSIEAYRRGVELSRGLKEQLDGAKQQLKILDEGENPKDDDT